VTSWIVEIDLPYLRHHWGEAYEISGSGERWAACRRDNLRKLTAGSAHALRDVIRADYLAAPVPRDTMPEQGGTHGSLRPA
jgi:hypothetical protein